MIGIALLRPEILIPADPADPFTRGGRGGAGFDATDDLFDARDFAKVDARQLLAQ